MNNVSSSLSFMRVARTPQSCQVIIANHIGATMTSLAFTATQITFVGHLPQHRWFAASLLIAHVVGYRQ